MGLFKKKLTEAEAAAIYVSAVFKAAAPDWMQLSELLKRLDTQLSEPIDSAHSPEGCYALAVLAQNLGSAVYYSPAFSTRRAQAHRLSTWALLSVLNNHSDELSPFDTEEILAKYRAYEASGLRAAKANEDPITPVANALFMDLFQDDLEPFMVGGTDEINPMISTCFTDVFMITIANTFKALRHVTEEYALVETAFPPT